MKKPKFLCSHRMIGETGKIYQFDKKGNITHIYSLQRCASCGKRWKREVPDMFESGRTLKRILSDFFSYEVYHSRRCVDLENPRFGEVVVNCNCTALGIVVLEKIAMPKQLPPLRCCMGKRMMMKSGTLLV